MQPETEEKTKYFLAKCRLRTAGQPGDYLLWPALGVIWLQDSKLGERTGMTTSSKLGLSLDFSDITFDDFREYGISDLVAGDVLDSEVLERLEHYARNHTISLAGKAILLTGLSSVYSIDNMETVCIFTVVDENGRVGSYRLSFKDARKIFAKRSRRRYNETQG